MQSVDVLDDSIQAWLALDPDPETRRELTALREGGDLDELRRRFAGRLAFGTAGLRGVVGAGPTRMNRLVIRQTSAGLASYLLDEVPDAASRGVFVTYDARPDSRRFAADAAGVFAALGIEVYLTAAAQPTPVGAFGVLHFGAAAGVVVTASHNPPQYNGYKVYWANGAQIIPPHDAGIAGRIEAASAGDVDCMSIDAAAKSGLIHSVGDELSDEYCRQVLADCNPGGAATTRKIDVAYTALHGVGGALAQKLLLESGLCDFESVASQHRPDGTFPTVEFPNPEEPGAMDAVVALAKERRSTLACANDPDADRLAVAVRDASGNYEMLTGDQIGVLLGHYLLGQPQDFTPIVCVSMVSSGMLEKIAESKGAVFHETLTGFKWLTNVALQHEDDRHRFLFAYEEALGYAVARLVRDKDGLSALLAFTRMTAALAADGRTVLDQLESLYRQYGLFVTEQRSIATEPAQRSITDRLRHAPPREIAGRQVASIKDLQAGTHRFADGSEVALEFFPSDVLIYYLSDSSRIIVRPSGTEPKVKCYYERVYSIPAGAEYRSALRTAKRELAELIAGHQESLQRLT